MGEEASVSSSGRLSQANHLGPPSTTSHAQPCMAAPCRFPSCCQHDGRRLEKANPAPRLFSCISSSHKRLRRGASSPGTCLFLTALAARRVDSFLAPAMQHHFLCLGLSDIDFFPFFRYKQRKETKSRGLATSHGREKRLEFSSFFPVHWSRVRLVSLEFRAEKRTKREVSFVSQLPGNFVKRREGSKKVYLACWRIERRNKTIREREQGEDKVFLYERSLFQLKKKEAETLCFSFQGKAIRKTVGGSFSLCFFASFTLFRRLSMDLIIMMWYFINENTLNL